MMKILYCKCSFFQNLSFQTRAKKIKNGVRNFSKTDCSHIQTLHAGDVCAGPAGPQTRLRGTYHAYFDDFRDSMSIGRRMLRTKVARFSLPRQILTTGSWSDSHYQIRILESENFRKSIAPIFKPCMLVMFVRALRARKRVCEAPTMRISMIFATAWALGEGC